MLTFKAKWPGCMRERNSDSGGSQEPAWASSQSTAEPHPRLWEQTDKAKPGWLDSRARLMDDGSSLHRVCVFVCVCVCVVCMTVCVYVHGHLCRCAYLFMCIRHTYPMLIPCACTRVRPLALRGGSSASRRLGLPAFLLCWWVRTIVCYN